MNIKFDQANAEGFADAMFFIKETIAHIPKYFPLHRLSARMGVYVMLYEGNGSISLPVDEQLDQPLYRYIADKCRKDVNNIRTSISNVNREIFLATGMVLNKNRIDKNDPLSPVIGLYLDKYHMVIDYSESIKGKTHYAPVAVIEDKIVDANLLRATERSIRQFESIEYRTDKDSNLRGLSHKRKQLLIKIRDEGENLQLTEEEIKLLPGLLLGDD